MRVPSTKPARSASAITGASPANRHQRAVIEDRRDTKCTALGGTLALAQTQVGIWYLNGSAKPVKGVTKVYISRVNARVTSSLCNFTLTGSADGTYTNLTSKLALRPRAKSGHALVASKVAGCAGLIKNKDKITFVGTFTVSTKKGKLNFS